jgi:hypothetical protein
MAEPARRCADSAIARVARSPGSPVAQRCSSRQYRVLREALSYARGASPYCITTAAMGLTMRSEDERDDYRRAAGRRSVGILERAARSRTRNEANGKTTAADQYRRTRRRARCDRTVRGASSRSPMRSLVIVSSPPSPTCARRPVARRPSTWRPNGLVCAVRGAAPLAPPPARRPSATVPQFSPENVSCQRCRFGATARHGSWRPQAAMGVGYGGVGGSSLPVRFVEQRVRPPPLLESTTPAT